MMKTILHFAFLLLFVAAGPVMAQSALRVGDTITLRLTGVPGDETEQFSGVYTIDAGGMINLPFIGNTKAAGLHSNVLERSIENQLKSEKIYTRPTIAVMASQVRFVNVGGTVRAPQRVPYTPDLTISSAINAAGGFTEFSDRKRVRLVRDSKSTIINMQDLKKNPSLDLAVKPGDQIDVPQAGLWPF